MASTSRITLRKDCEVSLIGNFSSQIIGSKLPSKRQMLKVLFFNLRVVKLDLQDSARLTIREATVFWEKARIPIQSENNSIPKLKRLYDEWRSIQKCSSRPVEKKSSTQIEKENKFIRELDDLFDIAAENALTSMKNKEDIEFLKLQREKGRPGYMHGIDKALAEYEERIFRRTKKAENYKKRKAQELVELRATHHARWMSKAIYSLKIYLFRNEFQMNATTKKALCDVCIFIVKIYVKHWFLSPLSTKAPLSDLNLIKNLYEYRNIDKVISDTALAKFLNHLWYLSPEAVALSLFDDDVSLEMKEKMRQNINNVDEFEEEMLTPSKRITFKHSEVAEIVKKELDQFIGPQTKFFFERFHMNYSFLSKASSEWATDGQYQMAKKITEKIKVVNDAAERGVRLIEDYNKKLSSDEQQKQYILQVVSNYRKMYPDFRKKTLVVELENCCE